jgi:hypothetical protein
MNTPEKSGEREIATRIVEATRNADTAIRNAIELLGEYASAETIATCNETLASSESLRKSMADWLFDPEQHCHNCFEGANEITEICHPDADVCRECLYSQKDSKAIAYLLGE